MLTKQNCCDLLFQAPAMQLSHHHSVTVILTGWACPVSLLASMASALQISHASVKHVLQGQIVMTLALAMECVRMASASVTRVGGVSACITCKWLLICLHTFLFHWVMQIVKV